MKMRCLEYKILEVENQAFDLSKKSKLTFKFNMDYEIFISEGKIYIDGKEVPKNNYEIKNGSVIVTFADNYVKTLP